MTAKDKTRTSRKNKKPGVANLRENAVFSEKNCRLISYEFAFPLADFDAKTFFRDKNARAGDRWSAVVHPRSRESGYHIHVSGRIDKKLVRVKMEYYQGARAGLKIPESEPSAESFMKTVGECYKEPQARAEVFTEFEKPSSSWRSLFNLPFKVTMGDREVAIEGITLTMPKNKFNANYGFIMRNEKHASIIAVVGGPRSVEFESFTVESDIVTADEAVRLVLEKTK